MEAQKEHLSDAEDIPSDFFDDFNKDEFIEGLSVIDSWDDQDGSNRRGSRINAEVVDSVKDLRELIRDGRDDERHTGSNHRSPRRERSTHRRPSASSAYLDDYIKPGSRRDPTKTKEAIKRDKEVKVKEYLAKHLKDDVKPPGTELDDFFEETEHPVRRSSRSIEEKVSSHSYRRPRSKEHFHHESSGRYYPRHEHWRSPRRSPHWGSPRRFSPHRRFKKQYSPWRSPRRYSPKRRSPLPFRTPYSRSPIRRSHNMRRSRSPSLNRKDNFLYPKESYPPSDYTSQNPYQMEAGQQYTYSMITDYADSAPGYSYPQGPAYAGGYGGAYDYAATQSVAPTVNVAPVTYAAPLPVPMPVPQPVPAPMSVIPAASSAPAMVPPPLQITSPFDPTNTSLPVKDPSTPSTPYDALAQLVAEGKISKEDYLKFTPNKGPNNPKDTNKRVMVLNRCHVALSNLGTMILPNRLVMNNNLVGQESKCLAPKYCSPLKRQTTVEFHFTNASAAATVQQNKQLVDCIITTLGLQKIISRPKKKPSKDMKDAAVQTTKPYCDVCEIRDSTKWKETGTSTDPEHFSASVYTQVVEQDLASSKSVFNPSGSIADGGPISIAHMTPAQLVSQLAARAKTLKQTEPEPAYHYSRRNPPYNYEGSYDGTGGGVNQYNNFNYRY